MTNRKELERLDPAPFSWLPEYQEPASPEAQGIKIEWGNNKEEE